MSLAAESGEFILTFKCLGLSCIRHELGSSDVWHTTKTVALAQVIIKPGAYKLAIYGQAGNTYFVANYGTACLTVGLIHMYFFLRRARLSSLISLLLNRHVTDNARIYAVYASRVFLTGFLQIKAFGHSVRVAANLLLTYVHTTMILRAVHSKRNTYGMP